jgi:hypothetical protein
MLSIICVMLSVLKLNAIMLRVILLSALILNVLRPYFVDSCFFKEGNALAYCSLVILFI